MQVDDQRWEIQMFRDAKLKPAANCVNPIQPNQPPKNWPVAGPAFCSLTAKFDILAELDDNSGF